MNSSFFQDIQPCKFKHLQKVSFDFSGSSPDYSDFLWKFAVLHPNIKSINLNTSW